MLDLTAFPRRIAVALALVAAVAFVGACGSEPTPTPTPRPTATPAPTPTPTAAPVSVPIKDLDITGATTVGEIIDALSDPEIDCVRDTIGAGTLDAMRGVALAEVPSGTADFPLDCLTLDNAVDLGIAFMSTEAGGLSAETRECVRGIALESPHVLGIGDPPAVPAVAMSGILQSHLCLRDEEAAALSVDRDVDLPPPSAVRCMETHLGGPESMVAVFSAAEPDTSDAFNLLSAAIACDATLSSGSADN